MNPERQHPQKRCRGRKGAKGNQTGVLSGEASAILRDQLLTEIAGVESNEDLDACTLRARPKANAPPPADGGQGQRGISGPAHSVPDDTGSIPLPAESDS